MFTENQLIVLDTAVDIYLSNGSMLVMDKLFDCSYHATKATLPGVLRNILNAVSEDVVMYILGATSMGRKLAVIEDDLLTDAHKIPKDAVLKKPSELIKDS